MGDLNEIEDGDFCIEEVISHSTKIKPLFLIAANVSPGRENKSLPLEEARETQVLLYASAFDSIHPESMISDEPSEFLNDIIGDLINAVLEASNDSAHNITFSFGPVIKDLQEKVKALWRVNCDNRITQQDFTIFEFKIGDVNASARFVFDEITGFWKLGYFVSNERIVSKTGKYFYEETTEGEIFTDPINEKTLPFRHSGNRFVDLFDE